MKLIQKVSRMKRDCLVLLMIPTLLAGFPRSFGCHNIETDQTEKNTETSGSSSEQNATDFFADVKVNRRKRSAVHQDVNIVNYFPGCLQNQLAATDYSNRKWGGPVSYAVYHSSWYEEVDDKICIGVNHTVECWIQRLSSFVSGLSPALLAAQRCVKEYTDLTSGRRNPTPRYPLGLYSSEASTCPVVDEDEYEKQFTEALNGTATELESDSSISEFAEVIAFAKNDLICLSCDCSDLDDDENSYDIDDNTNCGDCWSTRIAIAVRPRSRLRRPVRLAARKTPGLRKKPKPPKTPNNNRIGNQNANAPNGQNPRSGGNGTPQNNGNSPIPSSQTGGSDTRQNSGDARSRAVFVAPVGSTSSGNSRERTGTSSPRNRQQSRAVFVPPVGRTDADARRPSSSATATNERQQPEISPNRQRNTRIVQPVRREPEQQGSHSSPEGSAPNREQRNRQENSQRPQQSSTSYVQPLRRPSSTQRPTDSMEQNQPQSQSNQRSATDETPRSPEDRGQRSTNSASQRQQERPSRRDNLPPEQEKPDTPTTGRPKEENRSNEPKIERTRPRSTTDPPGRQTASGNRRMPPNPNGSPPSEGARPQRGSPASPSMQREQMPRPPIRG